LRRAFQTLWAVGLVGLVSLYYRNLTADFPNYSPWVDWSKFTDEGWYGKAAIEHWVRGSWYVPGDFNPSVALPVWPLMEAGVFHFTGVGLAAARALAVSVFIGALLALFFLVKKYQNKWMAGVVVTVLALSPFYYAFMRMAILEPPLLLFTVLALVAAAGARWRQWGALASVGVLVVLIVFTKTTGVCGLPAIAYLMWRTNHREWAKFGRCCVVVGAVALLLGGGYYLGLVRPHYAADFKYLFAANARPNYTLHSRWDAVWGAFCDGMWASRWFYPGAIAAVLLALTVERKLWRNPLFGACVLWIGGYFVFIAWHCNLQPRYYLLPLAPMVMLLSLALQQVVRERKRMVTAALVAVMVVGTVRGARLTFRWMRHPEFTYLTAARELTRTMDAAPGDNKLLMSISGDQLTLMTGVKAICDDFGTDELEARIARYDPGWYASWDDIDPETLASLQLFYRLEWVASWPAMDDPDRRVLNLWRLVPLKQRLWPPAPEDAGA
jgi:4-amino-4-deoxy-L-arabinose transferase-like glycosyltransferase